MNKMKFISSGKVPAKPKPKKVREKRKASKEFDWKLPKGWEKMQSDWNLPYIPNKWDISDGLEQALSPDLLKWAKSKI